VIGLADRLHDASAIALSGTREIAAAKQGVLAAVRIARDAGFTVAEDFSVFGREAGRPSALAARQARAQALAADIRVRVAELVATDQHVAATIAAAAADVGTVGFVDDGAVPGDERPAIQAVDNRKQAPQPEPPEPSPGPMPPITGADDVRRVLDPLQNGGKRGSNGVGTRPWVNEAWDSADVKRMWDYLTRNATDKAPSSRYDGVVRVLPDGTEIGFRRSEAWGDTIDVWYPDRSGKKVHTPYAPYFPSIGAPPQLPPPGDPAPSPVGSAQTGHVPIALPPSGIFDPNGLPPWLQNPSPGLHTAAQAPTIMPGVAVPQVPAAVTGPSGPGFLPGLGHDLAQAGKTAAAGTLAGIAIIGGLLAVGVTLDGQLARQATARRTLPHTGSPASGRGHRCGVPGGGWATGRRQGSCAEAVESATKSLVP
jgi:hypothetical protein